MYVYTYKNLEKVTKMRTAVRFMTTPACHAIKMPMELTILHTLNAFI